MGDTELHQRVQEHRYEIDTLKDTVNRVLISIDANTSAQHAMTTQFAVYVSKHETTENALSSLHIKSDKQATDIAAMKPVVDGLRGLVWKLLFASISGGSLVAAIGMLVRT